MYCGNLYICTKLAGQPNEIPDLITVESKNVEQLSKAIKLVLDKKNKFSEKSVKKYIINTYGIDNWVYEVKKVINNEKK